MAQVKFSDSLTSVVAGLGTDRDKSATTTYTQANIPATEIMNAYRYAWLPRRVVDQVAQDCFRKWRDWQGETEINGKLEREEKRLGARAACERAMIYARLYGRGHVYFDIGDDPSLPADPSRVGKGKLRFVTALSRNELADGEIDDDPMSPYYGQPSYYEVMSSTSGFVRIHPSRLVTFYGAEVPFDLSQGRTGDSVLYAAMPAIKRHDSVVANVAGLVFEARVDVITVPGLDVLMSDPEQSQAILNRFRLMAAMKGNNGLVMLSGTTNKDVPGEEWEQKNTSFATLPDIIEKAQQEVSGASGIPRALLFGTSAGGLGATGDLELSNYYDSVNTIQSNEIEPAMAVFDECLIRSALGNRPDDLWYTWASLWQVSAKEKAEIGARLAEKWTKINSILPAEVVAQSMVTDLTDAGQAPGLEAAYAEWKEGGGEIEEPGQPDDMPPDDDEETPQSMMDHFIQTGEV